MDWSLRIESRIFVFRRKGGNMFCITEKRRKHTLSLYLSGGMVGWFAKEIEVYWKNLGKMVDYQTGREGDKVFMLQGSHNQSGMFLKMIEYGTGSGKGILVIPKGRRGSGLAGFVRYLREMVESSSAVTYQAGRGMSKVGQVVNQSSSNLMADTSLHGDDKAGGGSYVAALMKLVQFSKRFGGAKYMKEVSLLKMVGGRREGQNSGEIMVMVGVMKCWKT
ncbi:uncharacterized protein LOC121245194 [Juglans microcarpa x Juglans regia]|uniref:uncharacterized protein LOC121245194 n=1 Tax=Juglans microcarpa x Juglans regia TaxID=2249226 RepID=UPI001B7F080A|nr:uncharacterized protein LOC121245194 [Juglans microcarpa x Juglans regia]